MQLRNRPFAEWVLIYYDSKKITKEKLLSLCKERGCKRAQIIEMPEVKVGETSIMLQSPFVTSSDLIVLEVNSTGKEDISIKAPKNWQSTKAIPNKVNGKLLLYLKPVKQIAGGKYKIEVSVGEETKTLSFEVVRKI